MDVMAALPLPAATGALACIWFGLILGISFIEAPLKFRARGVTTQIGLAIGRLVFRAVNTVEAVLATGLVIALIVGTPIPVARVALALAVLALALQLIFVRPQLARNADAVLAGAAAPRSTAHRSYVGLEVGKALCLLIGGAAALAV